MVSTPGHVQLIRMLSMNSNLPNDCLPIIEFVLYVDGATLSKSRMQLVELCHICIVNICVRSSSWYDIGICPNISVIPEISAERVSVERAFLFHRLIFVAFKAAMKFQETG